MIKATKDSSLIGCTDGLVLRCSPIVEVSSAERFFPHEEPAPCAKAIDERAAAGVHQAVGGEEGDLQPREVGVAERNLLLDRCDRDRQRLSIEVADRNREAEDERNLPAQRSDDVPPIEPIPASSSVTERANVRQRLIPRFTS